MLAPKVRPPADQIDWLATITVILSVAFVVAILVGLVVGAVALVRWWNRATAEEHRAAEERRAWEQHQQAAEAQRRAENEAAMVAQRAHQRDVEERARAGEAAAERQRQAELIARLGAERAAAQFAREAEARRRLESLAQRFGRAPAMRIMRGEVWQGQSAAELREALGSPADVDEKVMAKKTKHVFKYGHQGGAKFALRVTLDDGRVVGWDDKR